MSGYVEAGIAARHEWAPGLYMSAEDFEGRLKLLRRRHCSVLPLAEGVRRLYAGTLPPHRRAHSAGRTTVDTHLDLQRLVAGEVIWS